MQYTYTMVPRSEWGALPPTSEGEALPSPIFKVIMTKTGTPACSSEDECKDHIRKIQKFHMDKGMEDIPYSFILTPDCKMYEGRGWHKVVPTPKERPELKNKSIVIAHVGDFPDYGPEHREMVVGMFDMVQDSVHKTKEIHPDYELRCIKPNWNDITGIHEMFGIVYPLSYGRDEDDIEENRGI